VQEDPSFRDVWLVEGPGASYNPQGTLQQDRGRWKVGPDRGTWRVLPLDPNAELLYRTVLRC
jgi:hypothetical protein